jgi:hypothetical protein
MWYDRRDSPDGLGWDIRFTASLDGGDTFLPSIKVSEKSHSMDKSRWKLFPSEFASNSGTDNPVQLSVGLDAFHLSAGHTAGLAADADGVFHPFWIDNRTGVRQVWTSPVIVKGKAIANGSDEFSKLQDISSKAWLDLSNISYDSARDVVSLDAQLINLSKEVFQGPIKVRLVMARSALADDVRVMNADNGETNAGAVWDFGSRLKDNLLKPGQTSQAKRLTFNLSNVRQPRLDNFDGGLLKLDVRVLGKIIK